MDNKNKSGLVELIDTAEREIIVTQLEILRQRARVSVLSLEDVKILDILVKNLLLINGQTPESIDTTAKRIESVSSEELLKLALEEKKE